MKYFIPAILIVLCMASFGQAKEWRPFLNVALREDIVIAQQNIRGYNNAHIAPAYYPLGAQVMAGLSGAQLTAYVSYFGGHSPSIPEPDAHGVWATQQWTLGGRWHPAGIQLRPLSPFVGGGITLTTSRYDLTDSWLLMTFPSESRNDLGVMAEFGIIVPAARSVQVTLAAQLHRYETAFDGTHFYRNRHYVVLQPAFQLGVQAMGPAIF